MKAKQTETEQYYTKQYCQKCYDEDRVKTSVEIGFLDFLLNLDKPVLCPKHRNNP